MQIGGECTEMADIAPLWVPAFGYGYEMDFSGYINAGSINVNLLKSTGQPFGLG